MNDTLEDRLLAEQLHRIARGAPVSTTPVEDDVRRGQSRLRRRRALVAVGAAAVVGALATGALSLADSGADQRRTIADEPAIAAPPEAGPADDVLARQLESLREDSARLRLTLAELSAMTQLLQERLQGEEVLWMAAERATSWGAAGAADCPAGWTCDDVTVRGATQARFASSGTVRQVVAEFPANVVVLTFNAVDERPTDVAYGTD